MIIIFKHTHDNFIFEFFYEFSIILVAIIAAWEEKNDKIIIKISRFPKKYVKESQN